MFVICSSAEFYEHKNSNKIDLTTKVETNK